MHSTEVPGTQHAAPSTMAAAALAADASSESVAEVAEEDIVVLEEEEEDFDALVRCGGYAMVFSCRAVIYYTYISPLFPLFI